MVSNATENEEDQETGKESESDIYTSEIILKPSGEARKDEGLEGPDDDD